MHWYILFIQSIGLHFVYLYMHITHFHNSFPSPLISSPLALFLNTFSAFLSYLHFQMAQFSFFFMNNVSLWKFTNFYIALFCFHSLTTENCNSVPCSFYCTVAAFISSEPYLGLNQLFLSLSVSLSIYFFCSTSILLSTGQH